jgi:hypothetical protein
MMKEQLSKDMSAAFDGFINALDRFSESAFNHPVTEGGWSPGQVADHIFKATKAIPDKNTIPSDRLYNEKIDAIERQFLNFETKLKSPDFVYPEPGPFDKNQMLLLLQSVKEKHKLRIAERDLTEICVGYELPYIGTMTRYEWFSFIIVHVKRHTYQLNNMYVASVS